MPLAQQETLAQFLKTIKEGNEEVHIELFEIFLTGQRERKRQREKARKQYEKKKEKKQKSNLQVDAS